MRKTINAIKQFFGGTEHKLKLANGSKITLKKTGEESFMSMPEIDTEHEMEWCEGWDEQLITSNIDVAEYRYNVLDDFESPVMCGICGKNPAKYSVLTHPSDGPPYSHDYCGKCFTGPLAKEQIDAETPSR